jgi:hypothetical protein
MVFNATFNNISVLSWGSVLLDCQEKSTDMLQVTDYTQYFYFLNQNFFLLKKIPSAFFDCS